MAAFTIGGFLCWRIYSEEVSGDEVADFIKKLVSPMVHNSSYGILDNASNQKSDVARDALETVFNGRYKYCAPYSPRLKPIEAGFSLIKRFSRRYEREGEIDPIGLINRAFKYYSISGDGRHECKFEFYTYMYIYIYMYT
jgi:transposase